MKAALFASIPLIAQAAVDADAVKALPGFSGALPSKLYSVRGAPRQRGPVKVWLHSAPPPHCPPRSQQGYLDGGAGKHAHYMFSESLKAPSTDPIVLWFNVRGAERAEFPSCARWPRPSPPPSRFSHPPPPASLTPRFRFLNQPTRLLPQGGPGCSSMEGAMSESGLYRIQEFSDPPTVAINPYSWNNVSNNLFIEAPAGVGFSYCDKAAGCAHTDTSTANDNLAALVSFFKAYPEYAGNELWITGESYAGVYVPSLAFAVYNYNKGGPAAPINLKGIMVGNGCIGREAGHCGNDPTGLSDYHDLQMWRGHGLVSETTYDQCLKACVWANENAECQNCLDTAANEIGDIDVYCAWGVGAGAGG